MIAAVRHQPRPGIVALHRTFLRPDGKGKAAVEPDKKTLGPVSGGAVHLVYLIPIALGLGAIGLAAFLWTLRSGQYDDLDGAAERILFDDD